MEWTKLLLASGQQCQASAEPERLRREQAARQRAQREAEDKARPQAAEAAQRQERERQGAQGEARGKAAEEAAARRPMGVDWIVAKSQPRRVYNPNPVQG